MKRFLLICLAALALGGIAPALGQTLARQVQTEAVRLKAQLAAADAAALARPGAKPAPLSQTLVSDLQRFGLVAGRLSLEIDGRGGPADLRCIFRGMAAETDAQLKAVSQAPTGVAQSKALGRLVHMLGDAAEIAPAADGGVAPRPAAARAAAIAQCPAER